MNEAAYLQQQYEEEPDVIEAGDYVRIVEDVDSEDDHDLIYMRDIQAVHRVVRADDTLVTIETLRGTYVMMAFQVYLVDIDALHGEMEEMLAEEAAEKIEKDDLVWIKPYELNKTEDDLLSSSERAMKARAVCRVNCWLEGELQVEYPYPAGLLTRQYGWHTANQIELADIEALTIAENSNLPEVVAALLDEHEALEARELEISRQLIAKLQAEVMRTTTEIQELCRMLGISVTWSDVPGLERNNHDLLEMAKPVIEHLQSCRRLAKSFLERKNRMYVALEKIASFQKTGNVLDDAAELQAIAWLEVEAEKKALLSGVTNADGESA